MLLGFSRGSELPGPHYRVRQGLLRAVIAAKLNKTHPEHRGRASCRKWSKRHWVEEKEKEQINRSNGSYLELLNARNTQNIIYNSEFLQYGQDFLQWHTQVFIPLHQVPPATLLGQRLMITSRFGVKNRVINLN